MNGFLSTFCFCILIVVDVLSAHETAENVFTQIYEKGVWGWNEHGKGTSGKGSTVENALPYMKFLEDFIVANAIKSVVDVGCGDWSFTKHLTWEGIHYTGIDVVKSVIETNQALFGSSTIQFIHGDIVEMDLPSADLLICKDVLQHLPNEDIVKFLKKIRKYKYCLITNDIGEAVNCQIQKGDYRTLDLTLPPFNVEGTKVFTFTSGPDHMKQVLFIAD